MTGKRNNVHNGAGRDLDPKGARKSTRALDVTGRRKSIKTPVMKVMLDVTGRRKNMQSGTGRDRQAQEHAQRYWT